MLSCFGWGAPKQKQEAKPEGSPPSTPPPELSEQPSAATAHPTHASQPCLSPRPAPSATGNAGAPSLVPVSDSSIPAAPPPQLDHGSKESTLLKATPFSVLVLTSDAKEVLLHRKGHEPVAALYLDQVLQLHNPIGPLSTPFVTATGAPVHGLASQSFLCTLLGPDLEAEALATLERGRPWKRTVFKHLAGEDVHSYPGVVSGSAFSKGPPAQLGTLFERTEAQRSRSVGMGCAGVAGAEQAISADGHLDVACAGQNSPQGVVPAAREYRFTDSLAAAAARQGKPKRWLLESMATCSASTGDQMSSDLDHHHVSKTGKACPYGLGLSSGVGGACGVVADVNAPICKEGKGNPPDKPSSEGLAMSGVADADVAAHGFSASRWTDGAAAAVMPSTAAADGIVRIGPSSDPMEQVWNSRTKGIASGRHMCEEACSPAGTSTQRTGACENRSLSGYKPAQYSQHRSSAAGNLSRSSVTSDDANSSGSPFHTAGSAAWEHMDSRGLPAVKEAVVPRKWDPGGLNCDTGLVIGKPGEDWGYEVAGQSQRAGTGACALAMRSSLETRSKTVSSSWREGCGEQGDDAIQARVHSKKQAGQGGRLEGRLAEAKSVPSASFACSSQPVRGSSSSSRNHRSFYVSDRALEQLRDRDRCRRDDFQSKTIALLTSISQLSAPAKSKRPSSLNSRQSLSTPSQISQHTSPCPHLPSPKGCSSDGQSITVANVGFHEPSNSEPTDLNGGPDGVTFQPTCSASKDAHTSLSHAVQNLSDSQLYVKKMEDSLQAPGPPSALSPRVSPSQEQRDSQDIYTPFTDHFLTEAHKEGTPTECQTSKPSAFKSILPQPAPSMLSQGDLKELVEMSFDVVVSALDPPEAGIVHKKSPLVVAIYNTTEHTQLLSTLSALAENQLELISSFMPQHAIQFLAMESTEAVPSNVAQLARKHTGITLLFMDIVGFTTFAKAVEPVDVMMMLNTLFSLFDALVDKFGVHKVETAGDCYIVSGGIMSPTNQADGGLGLVLEDHDHMESAAHVMEFAKAMLEVAQQVQLPNTEEPVRVRVGMHTGDVVSGLIGSKLPKFSIFGDTMNTASRMESTGVPGRIHVSETSHEVLQHAYRWEATGGVDVKGKGRMQTYLWVPPSESPSTSQPLPLLASQSLQHANHLKRTCTLLQDLQQQQQQQQQQQRPDSRSLPLVKEGH